MPVFNIYFIIREATTGAPRIIHRTRDAGMCAFHQMIRDGDFDDCIELMEVVVNDRGRVVSEVVTYSYSKVSRYVVTHVLAPSQRPPPLQPHSSPVRVVSNGGEGEGEGADVPEFKSLTL
jgi:hypothetical protein